MVRTGGAREHHAEGGNVVSETKRKPRAHRKLDRRDIEEIFSKVAELEWRLDVLEQRTPRATRNLSVVEPPASIVRR